MTIKITSTTDTPEQVTAANSAETKTEKSAENPAAAEAKASSQAEKDDASGASKEEQEEEALAESEGDEEEEKEESEDKGQKPASKKGLSKRFSQLTKRAREAEERAIRAEERAKLLEAQSQKGQGDGEHQRQPKQENAAKRPVKDDYEDHDEYVAAVVAFEIKQHEQARETKEKEKEKKSELQTKVDKYRAGVKELEAEHDDYQQVIESCEVDVPRFIEEILLESDNGPKLAYALAKNPRELARISALSPTIAAKEIGKFEAKHLPAPEQKESKETKITRAPAPITPVGSKGGGAGAKSIYAAESLSQKEYERLRKEGKSA